MRLVFESLGPRPPRLRTTFALLAALCWSTPALAEGDSDEAKGTAAEGSGDTEVAAETFRAGMAAYERKDYRAAALSFEMAHRLAPHGAALYNAGLAWHAAEEMARAADAYQEALATDQLSEAQREDSQTRLDELQASLGRVTIEAPDGSTFSVAAHEGASTPRTIHLPPGNHDVHAKLVEGTRLMQTVAVEVGTAQTLTFDKPMVKDEPPPSPPGDASPLLPVGLGLVGLGAVTGGAAVFLGLSALGARDDFEASGNTDVEAHDDAESLRLFTNVAWVGAGVFAAAGAVFIVLELTHDDASDGQAAWQLQVAPQPGGVSLHGRF